MKDTRAALRSRAEAVLRDEGVSAAARDLSEVGALIHELDVYGAELEMQNESLRQAQDELAASRDRYAELFRNAPVGYLVLDHDGVVIDANPAALVQLSRERAHTLGRPLTPMLGRACRTDFARMLAAASGEQRRGGCELEVAPPGEPVRNLLAEAVLVPHDADARRLVLCATLDISDRRRAELERARSEEKYRSLFETSRDAIFIVTPSGRVIEGNVAAGGLVGCAPAALATRPLADLVASEDLPALKALLEDEFGGGGLLECAFLRRGVRVPAEVSASRTFANLVQLIVRDATERLRAAEERERLALRVQQSQRLEALGRLAGGIAHDMNNVLAAVLSIGSDLHDSLGGHPAADDLATIVAAARQGADLTRGLLAFARGDPSPFRPLSLTEVCRGVVALVSRTAPRSVRVVARLADEELVVEGDGGALGQLVLNLCVNSIDAMPDGGELRIESSVLADGRRVGVQVRDTGQGMDEATAALAFEPFFTTKPAGKGTGLGLAMAYGTARAHGGELHIESVPGRGTTVSLALPRSAARVETAPAVTPPVTHARRRALVVDDDPLVLRGVAKLLKKLGFETTLTHEPKRALEQIEREGPFAIYVLDVQMPDIDGIALARQLLERDPQARVLFMSGYSARRVPEELTSRPTIHFVGKPFDMTGLLEAVRVLLG